MGEEEEEGTPKPKARSVKPSLKKPSDQVSGTFEPDRELRAPKKSSTPTWMGKVLKAKDEQIEATKELADEKAEFIKEQTAASAVEREKMSKSLYKLSEERAADMQRAMEGRDTTIKRLWIANVIQVFIIAALAGVTVTGKIPGVGDIGLDKGKPAKIEKTD